MYQEKKIRFHADPKLGLIPVEFSGFSPFDPKVAELTGIDPKSPDLSAYDHSNLFQPISFDGSEDHSELLAHISAVMRERHGAPVPGITGSGRGRPRTIIDAIYERMKLRKN